MLTIESAHGATYLKLNGITRFIWLPASTCGAMRIEADWRRLIFVVGVFGRCVVFAPLRPRGERW